MKEKKVKLKIMIILEKDDKQFYGFFNWDDFVIPSSFDPHTKKKTSIRLKNVFDISKLIKF